jgi:hypothetical protein
MGLLGTLGALAVLSPHGLSLHRQRIADRDCRDFRTQAEAEAFFKAQGPGDPHRLDADHDGVACEWNPKPR